MRKYVRNLNNNYLIFEEESETFDMLTVSMLQNNRVEGMLRPEISKSGAKIEFAYEISRMQPMPAMFEGKPMTRRYLQILFDTLHVLSQSLEAYFLDANHIVLDPACIFWDRAGEQVFFCYDPFTDFDGGSLHLLCETILAVIDPEDATALKTACLFFRMVKEEAVRLEEILDSLRQPQTEEAAPAYLMTEPAVQTVNETVQFLTDVQKEKEEAKRPVQRGIAKLFAEEEEDWEKEVLPPVPYSEAKPEKTKKAKRRRSKTEKERELLQPMPGCGDPAHLAGWRDNGNISQQFALTALNKGQPSFEVGTFPFLIGSIPYAADACIKEESISRFHAKFDLVKGEIRLSDLHSAEGTWLNGVRLEDGISEAIRYGDRIRLGRLEFEVRKAGNQ